MIGIPQRFCEAKDLWEEEEQAVKVWRLPKADAREIRLAPTRRAAKGANPVASTKGPYFVVF